MVKLTRIYTRTGDAGGTMLGDGSKTTKTDPRVEAYGTVDEANASVGAALVTLADDHAIAEELARVQHDLFDVGADLCVPITDNEGDTPHLRVTDAQVTRLERAIDDINENLQPLDSFVLPGGSPAAAALHVARTVVRRAERRTAALLDAEPQRVNPRTVVYLNRLSDLLFVMARAANDNGQADVLWKPGANRD